MSSPRFDFENMPLTLGEGGLPPPDSPVIPGGSAAAAAGPSYYLDVPEHPSPSAEALAEFYRNTDNSRRINRELFPEAENKDEEDPEVAMLKNHFGIIETAAAAAKYGAGWISAIKQDYGYEPLQYGLVPRRGAAPAIGEAPARAPGKKRKRQGKRGGGKKKYKKKRTKKKSRRRKRKTLKKKRKRRRKTRR